MNAVIIYDGFDLGSNAYAMLARAANRADATLRWSVRLWRLDMLLHPQTADTAYKDATEAHVMVLAVRRLTEVPPTLLDWLETWAGHRDVQDAALAVFDGGSGNMVSAMAIPELSQFAGRHGLSLILGDMHPHEDEPAGSGFDWSGQARKFKPLILPQTFGQPIDDHQAWGIND